MPDIAVWHKCDNRCVMCTNMASFSGGSGEQYGLKAQISKMERWLAGDRGVYWKNPGRSDYLNLTGGEPTLHPEFLKLLAYFRKRLPGTDINLLTHGRRLADAAFLDRLLKIAAPPFGFIIPLHGPTPAVHDAITGVKGSFAATLSGLRNLFARAEGRRIEIRLVLHRRNIAAFGRTLGFLLKEFPDTARYRAVAIHYEIEGACLENHRKVALRLSDSAKVLKKEAGLIRRFADFRIYHFPLCLVDRRLRDRCQVTLPREDRVYTRKCAGCPLRRGCLGLMLEYYKLFGDGELRPPPSGPGRAPGRTSAPAI